MQLREDRLAAEVLPKCTSIATQLNTKLTAAATSQVHTGTCDGHLGVRRTMVQIQRRAFWPDWRRDIRRFCRQCPNCNGYFRGQLPTSGQLQPMITGAPLERLHIDVTGPHPRSRRGSVLIVSCLDPFTK